MEGVVDYFFSLHPSSCYSIRVHWFTKRTGILYTTISATNAFFPWSGFPNHL